MQYKFKTYSQNGIDVSTTTYNAIPPSFKAFIAQYFPQVLCRSVPELASVVLNNARTGAVIDSTKWPDLAEFQQKIAVFVSVKAPVAPAPVAAVPEAVAAAPENPAVTEIKTAEQELQTATKVLESAKIN